MKGFSGLFATDSVTLKLVVTWRACCHCITCSAYFAQNAYK